MKKNNILKTTTVGLTVITMLIGAGVSSMAYADPAPTPVNNDITITAPAFDSANYNAPTINGRSFKAYQFAKYTDVQVKDGKIIGYNMEPVSPYTQDTIRDGIKAAIVESGSVISNFSSIVELDGTGKPQFKGEAENLTPLQFVGKYFYGTVKDNYGNNQADNVELRKFATYMQKYGSTAATPITATGADNKVNFVIPDNVANEGLYLIVEPAPTQAVNTKNDENETVARAMIVGTAATVNGTVYNQANTKSQGEFTLGELKLKAEKVTVTKTANDKLVTVGSTKDFTITTNVPNYEEGKDYKTPTFTITDNPSDNLTVNTSTIVVKATDTHGNVHTLVKDDGSGYTLDTTNGNSADTNDFKITLNNPVGRSGNKITVTYTATVQSMEALTNEVTDNKVTVDFSNNPTVDSETVSVETEKRVYDSAIAMDKVKFDDANVKLLGAEFTVKQGNTPVNFTPNADGTEYTVAKTGGQEKVTVMAEGADGPKTVNFRGLAADTKDPVTYTFTESKAPAGYILGENPITFNLTVTPNFKASTDELESVTYKITSDQHDNFLDMTDNNLRTVAGNVVTVPAADATSTVIKGGKIVVENTENIQDFARTGGDILTIAGIAAALVVAGGAALIIAKKRNNQALA